MKNIIDALQWRYATKQFDATKQLDAAELHLLEEAMRLAPSSFGLQPWKFLVISNPEVRAKLRAAAWGQPQVTEASHLIVFAIHQHIDETYIDNYIQYIAATRNSTIEQLKDFSMMIKGSFKGKSTADIKQWSTHQAYLALGTLLTTAAHEGIDACPMEGFDAKQFDDILGLNTMGLESRVMAAVGFRANDPIANLAKVRFPKEDVIIEVK
jgi:nitroreductase